MAMVTVLTMGLMMVIMMVTVLTMGLMMVIMMVMALVRIIMNSANTAIGTTYANTLRPKEA